MSTVSFNHSKQSVKDLLSALPAPAASKIDRSRGEDTNKEAKPGFNDLLRNSTEPRRPQQRVERPEQSEPIDTQPKSDVQKSDQPESAKPQETDQRKQASDSTDGQSQQGAQGGKSDQAAEQGASTSTQKSQEASDDVQLQADADAVSAQLAFVESMVVDQSQAASQTTNTQQADGELSKDAIAAAKQSAQVPAAASALLSNNAASAHPSQSTNSTASQAASTAVMQPTLQQGDHAQTGSGDANGDGKAATTSSSVNTPGTTNSNTASAAAFNVPDSSTSESRLPINPASVTQSADAARQAQAQTAAKMSDNDSLNTARLTRGLANAVQQRGGAVTLRLTPPEMGTVRIQMHISGTSVSASFHAESASAQTLLTNQLAQLRSALESKGMSVERLSVQPMASTAASQNASQSQNQSDTQQQNQNQQQNAGEGRSRGQYSGSSGRQGSDQQQDNNQQQARRGFFDRLSDASESEAA